METGWSELAEKKMKHRIHVLLGEWINTYSRQQNFHTVTCSKSPAHLRHAEGIVRFSGQDETPLLRR